MNSHLLLVAVTYWPPDHSLNPWRPECLAQFFFSPQLLNHSQWCPSTQWTTQHPGLLAPLLFPPLCFGYPLSRSHPGSPHQQKPYHLWNINLNTPHPGHYLLSLQVTGCRTTSTTPTATIPQALLFSHHPFVSLDFTSLLTHPRFHEHSF